FHIINMLCKIIFERWDSSDLKYNQLIQRTFTRRFKRRLKIADFFVCAVFVALDRRVLDPLARWCSREKSARASLCRLKGKY
ncbi:MAG: hypothetical protein K8S27_08855, partial [Candidatus Omnitrophica bacterium]|nr:hypothetical protein [Candidatus Omnitrophota bacterium]